MDMRGPDGETPRGTGGEPGSGPLFRPPWNDDVPDVPWYKRVSRQQLYWIGGVIFAIHAFFIWGFFQDVNIAPVDRMRWGQKVLENYQSLPACVTPRVDGAVLTPVQPLAVPDIVSTLRLNGKVGLGIRLTPDGSVAGACLAQTSGNPGLDNAIYAAARTWKFKVPGDKPELLRLMSLDIADPTKPIAFSAWTPPPPAPAKMAVVKTDIKIIKPTQEPR
jgi:TonB family protein